MESSQMLVKRHGGAVIIGTADDFVPATATGRVLCELTGPDYWVRQFEAHEGLATRSFFFSNAWAEHDLHGWAHWSVSITTPTVLVGAADASITHSHPRILDPFRRQPAMAPVLPGPEARAPLALTDHVLEEVLIRIGVHADLIRASAACKTFRRLITDPAFLRRYRTLHPPMLLGFVGCAEPADIRFIPTGPAIRFQPAEAPHPNAPAARAFAAAADFSFDHHDDSGMSSWPRYDARDGRVLLMSSDTLRGSLLVSPVLSVYDPLTRACTQLPPIPDDLRVSVLVQYEHMSFFDALFDPSGANEEAPFREETQFRVMCLASCFLMTVVFVYSSVSGSWSHDTSIVFSALGLDLPPLYYPIMGGLHSYAYGCLYWDVGINNQIIKLDIDSMESSSVSLPLDHENRNTMFVEAGEGGIGMFSLILQSENPQSLYYSIWQNESENATEHPVENTIPLSSEYDFYHFSGAAGGYIFLIGLRKDFVPGSVFFSVEIKTLKVQRVCEANFGPDVYWHFRPFMSPRRI